MNSSLQTAQEEAPWMKGVTVKIWPRDRKSLTLDALRHCLGDDPALRAFERAAVRCTAKAQAGVETGPEAQAGLETGPEAQTGLETGPEQAAKLYPGQVPGQRYLIEYADFPQSVVAGFDAAVATGRTEDSAAGFVRFASTDFSQYTAFLNHWVRSDFVQDQIVINLGELYDNPVVWLHRVLQRLTPGQPPTTAQMDRITAQAPSWVAAHPAPDVKAFRHYQPVLFDQLGRLVLRREVVQETFKEMLGRVPTDDAILHFQCTESRAALHSQLLATPENQGRKAQTADSRVENLENAANAVSPQDIKTGYLLLLDRHPSSEEIQQMQKHVTDLSSLREMIVGSAEFTEKYSKQFRPNQAKSVTQSEPEKKGDGRVSAPATLLPRDSERIVFLHIPKCGGTTLHSVLKLWYGENQMHAERFNELYYQDIMGLGSRRVFSGHFDFYSTSFIPGPKTFISVLRDPMDRLISFYNFYRAHGSKIIEQQNLQHGRWANEYDIDSYFAHPIIRSHHFINNSMVRHFSNIPQIDNSLLPPSMQSVGLDEMLDQAIENLSKFVFIGFMDQYESDVVRLAQVLSMTAPRELHKEQVLDNIMDTNLAMKRIEKQRPSPASLEAMEELIAFDRIFYARARALFAS